MTDLIDLRRVYRCRRCRITIVEGDDDGTTAHGRSEGNQGEMPGLLGKEPQAGGAVRYKALSAVGTPAVSDRAERREKDQAETGQTDDDMGG